MPTRPPLNQRTLVLANWKMNLSVAESVQLAKKIASALSLASSSIEVGVCPTFPALPGVALALKRKKLALGAQDVFWKQAGPYTGEVSAKVLKELGVRYVIVGHSERRQYLKESDDMVRQKVAALLAEGLIPVLCVGETFAERQVGQKDVVVARQVAAALQGLSLPVGSELVVAYEPVWVIGSGQAVAPEEAFHTAQVIHQSLIDMFSTAVVVRQVRLIYGGSVDPSNITSFIRPKLLSGVLVGGASLDAKRFAALLKEL